jgi:hypothetical protein
MVETLRVQEAVIVVVVVVEADGLYLVVGDVPLIADIQEMVIVAVVVLDAQDVVAEVVIKNKKFKLKK